MKPSTTIRACRPKASASETALVSRRLGVSGIRTYHEGAKSAKELEEENTSFIDIAFDSFFDQRDVEVDKVPEFFVCQFQVGQQLSFMNLLK